MWTMSRSAQLALALLALTCWWESQAVGLSVDRAIRALLVEDALIDENDTDYIAVDANVEDIVRLEGSTGADGRKILFATLMIKDTNHQWSPSSGEQPDWMASILGRNTEILSKFGHKMVLRQSTGPLSPTPWQHERCEQTHKTEESCVRENQREDANWQKEEMMYKYLHEPGLTHVMILDGDAVLARRDVDTLRRLADIVDNSGKDMLLTNEDWYVDGDKQVNGGLLFAKVSDFSKQYFGELVAAHQKGAHFESHFHCARCMSNEQLCIKKWMDANCMDFKDHYVMATSIKYNFHPQVWMEGEGRHPITPSTRGRKVTDPELEVIHFMGVAKNIAPQILAQLAAGDAGAPAAPEEMLQVKPRTCNDGRAEAECFDVEACASEAPAKGKYALVLSQDLSAPLELPLPNLPAMTYLAKKDHLDVVMLVPNPNTTGAANSLTAEQRAELVSQGVKIVEVPWMVPPNMHIAKNKQRAAKQFMRLHAFGLEDYDAVAFYTDRVELQKDVTPVLRCAARGYFLSTGGPRTPLSPGFFAVKPSSALLKTAKSYAKSARFSDEKGWDGVGFKPMPAKYPDADLVPGFLHALLYKRTRMARQAMEKSGLKLAARQIDHCAWNYQGSCPTPGFSCRRVRAHFHSGNGAGCWKYGAELHALDKDYA